MQITIDVDLEKFRYSLIGDGYLKEEALELSEEELVDMLKRNVHNRILMEFEKGRRIGLY